MAIHKNGGGMKGKVGSKGQETEGDTHPIYVMRKAISLGKSVLTHRSNEVSEITSDTAHRLLRQYDEMRTPDQKELFVGQIWQSNQSFMDLLAGKVYKPDKTRKISLAGSVLIGGIGRRNY